MNSRTEGRFESSLAALGHEAVLAVDAVREAVRFVGTVHHEPRPPSLTKLDASPVTIADFVVQALIVSRLASDLADDPIVAEEDAAPLRTRTGAGLRRGVIEHVQQWRPGSSAAQVLDWIDRGKGTWGRRFWTIDPIDGTKGLMRGGQYVIALALVVDGVVQVGVLGCPRLSMTASPLAGPSDAARIVPVDHGGQGGIAIAVRGQGAWWMSRGGGRLAELSVSAEADATRARALHSYESRHADVSELHRVLDELGGLTEPVLMDSQAKHVLLAAGAAEFLLRVPADPQYREAIWDHAAGSLLIEEAGGRVTDLDGHPLDFTTGRRLLRNRGLIASNGLVHEAVLRAIRQGRVQ